MEALALQTVTPTVHWEDNTGCISVVESKIVTPRGKHIDIPVCFLQEQLKMVFLFKNMKGVVSCRQICAPNHVKVQLSVGVINVCLDLDSI